MVKHPPRARDHSSRHVDVDRKPVSEPGLSRGAVVVVGSGLVIQICSISSSILMARFLGPDEMGLVTLAVTLTWVPSFIGSYVENGALIADVPSDDESRAWAAGARA